jgi:hypothetical protein
MFRNPKIVIATAVPSLGLTSVSHAASLTTFTASPDPTVLGSQTDFTLSITVTADPNLSAVEAPV